MLLCKSSTAFLLQPTSYRLLYPLFQSLSRWEPLGILVRLFHFCFNPALWLIVANLAFTGPLPAYLCQYEKIVGQQLWNIFALIGLRIQEGNSTEILIKNKQYLFWSSGRSLINAWPDRAGHSTWSCLAEQMSVRWRLAWAICMLEMPFLTAGPAPRWVSLRRISAISLWALIFQGLLLNSTVCKYVAPEFKLKKE